MSDITNMLIDGQRFYHEEEMYRRIKKAYDTGYGAAIRDVATEINKRGGVSKKNLKDTLLYLMKPIEERYNISYDR